MKLFDTISWGEDNSKCNRVWVIKRIEKIFFFKKTFEKKGKQKYAFGTFEK